MRRTWDIGPFHDDFGNLSAPSEDDLARELIGASFALGRWGGSLVVAPKRVRYPETGEFETVGWILKYDSGNVPAVDVPRGQRAEDPEPVEEPLPPEPSPEPELTPQPEAVPEPALAE